MALGFLTSLRGKIVAVVGLLVAAGLLLLSATNVYTARSHALQSLVDQTKALSRAHAAGVADWVASRKQVVLSFAGAVPEAEPVKYLQQAKIAGDVDTAYIGFADKRTAFSSPQDLPADYDPTSRPWYQLAAKESGPVVTDPYLDAGTKKLVITFAAAVKNGAQVAAVTALDVFMDGVVRNVASIRPTPGTYGLIVGKDGKIVVHEDTSLAMKPITDIAPRSGRRRAGCPGQRGHPARSDAARRNPPGVCTGHSRDHLDLAGRLEPRRGHAWGDGPGLVGRRLERGHRCDCRTGDRRHLDPVAGPLGGVAQCHAGHWLGRGRPDPAHSHRGQ